MFRIANVIDRASKFKRVELIGEYIKDPTFGIGADGGEWVYMSGEHFLIQHPVMSESLDPTGRLLTITTNDTVYTLERID